MKDENTPVNNPADEAAEPEKWDRAGSLSGVRVGDEENVSSQTLAEDLRGSGSAAEHVRTGDTIRFSAEKSASSAPADDGKTIAVHKIEDIPHSDSAGGSGNMPEDRKKKTKRKPITLAQANRKIIICLLIILIPIVVFVVILYKARQETHTPILGNRLEGQLNPAITDSDKERVVSAISALEGVESVEFNAIVSTARITVNTADDLTQDQMQELSASVYAAVTEILPVETYFTNSDSQEMYDLEITLYNNLDYEYQGDPALCIIEVVKNGMAESASTQVLTTPRNASAAAQALKNVEERNAEESGETDDSGETTEEEATEQ